MVYVDAGDKTKMGKVERFNKTLRNKIMTYCKTFKTLTCVHSSTGYKPDEVTHEFADAIRKREENRMNKAVNFIKQFKAGDKVRIKKYKKMFQKGTDRWSSGIYTIESVEKLSLTLKNPKGVLVERVKPYNVKLVTEDTQKAPEEPEVPKHSVKENQKMNKFKRKQVAEGFEQVDDEGQVVVKERMKPKDEKRTDTLAKKKEEPKVAEPQDPVVLENVNPEFKVGDRVKAPFKVKGVEVYFEGTIKKKNPKTLSILWSDGQTINMNPDELEPVEEPEKMEEPKLEPKAEEKPTEIQEGDKVKGEFKKSDGTKQWYEGVVQKVNPKTYWVLWSDGARLLMKKSEVFKI